MDRSRARLLANQFGTEGRPTAWFEVLYREANNGTSVVPWADMRPNPNLVAWLDAKQVDGSGQPGLKVGCGYGDDVEELVRRGYEMVGFDIAPTAVAVCLQRFPCSSARYDVADLFQAPAEWQRAFTFVLESYTLQVLPPAERQRAMSRIAEFVAPQGLLLVITRGRDATDNRGQMPWPLTREEVLQFQQFGLSLEKFEDYLDNEEPPVRRFRAVFSR